MSLNALVDDDIGGPALPCEKIVVIPVKPSRTLAAPVVVLADTPTGISMIQFVRSLQDVQRKYWRKPSAGIGLYRLGIHRGIPSFYAGEYYDLAGFLLRAEKQATG